MVATKDLARMSFIGLVSLTEIRLVEKFWCSWQIKQSLHPILPVVAFDVCSEVTTEVVESVADSGLLCR